MEVITLAKLKLITMSDIPTEQVEWLWKPYLPAGKISIIQGDGGDGKTTTATAIAAAISKGEALPGGDCAAPAHIIIQNAEDGISDTIKPRLEQLGADMDRIHFIDETSY
jgi:RecA-family ATPase